MKRHRQSASRRNVRSCLLDLPKFDCVWQKALVKQSRAMFSSRTDTYLSRKKMSGEPGSHDHGHDTVSNFILWPSISGLAVVAFRATSVRFDHRNNSTVKRQEAILFWGNGRCMTQRVMEFEARLNVYSTVYLLYIAKQPLMLSISLKITKLA